MAILLNNRELATRYEKSVKEKRNFVELINAESIVASNITFAPYLYIVEITILSITSVIGSSIENNVAP